MNKFDATNKTIDIKGREYKVGYAKEVRSKPGVWSLGLEGKPGAIFSAYAFPDGTFSKLIRV